MGHHQVRVLGNRLGGRGGSDRQARHHAADLPAVVADKEADVIPVFCQTGGGETFKEFRNRPYGRHDIRDG